MKKDDEVVIEVNKKKSPRKINNNKKNSKSKNKKKNTVRLFDYKKQKERKRIFNVLTIFVLIMISAILLLSSSVFNIKEIIVENNELLSDEEIISLSRIERGRNAFSISKTISISNVKENPYIDTVAIKRILPNKIKVTVTERAPKYMLQYADSYVYIDRQGYMLEISNKKLDIPILTGVTTDLASIKAGNRISIEDLKKLNHTNNIMEVSSSNEIVDLITQIDISDDKNYTIILETEGKTVYLGDCTELSTRILYLKSILEEEKGKSGEVFLNVDLNNQRVRFRETE